MAPTGSSAAEGVEANPAQVAHDAVHRALGVGGNLPKTRLCVARGPAPPRGQARAGARQALHYSCGASRGSAPCGPGRSRSPARQERPSCAAGSAGAPWVPAGGWAPCRGPCGSVGRQEERGPGVRVGAGSVQGGRGAAEKEHPGASSRAPETWPGAGPGERRCGGAARGRLARLRTRLPALPCSAFPPPASCGAGRGCAAVRGLARDLSCPRALSRDLPAPCAARPAMRGRKPSPGAPHLPNIAMPGWCRDCFEGRGEGSAPHPPPPLILPGGAAAAAAACALRRGKSKARQSRPELGASKQGAAGPLSHPLPRQPRPVCGERVPASTRAGGEVGEARLFLGKTSREDTRRRRPAPGAGGETRRVRVLLLDINK